ncbi:unnamed protein product, partial [Meganyctiphanes norvegica]
FNAHIGLLGAQTIDRNGRMILKWLNEYNLTMLNLDDRCEGTTTWEARDQKSTVDFVLVNQKMYSRFIEMEIDEKREKIDISDHNLITVTFKMKKQIEKIDKGKSHRKRILHKRQIGTQNIQKKS